MFKLSEEYFSHNLESTADWVCFAVWSCSPFIVGTGRRRMGCFAFYSKAAPGCWMVATDGTRASCFVCHRARLARMALARLRLEPFPAAPPLRPRSAADILDVIFFLLNLTGLLSLWEPSWINGGIWAL